MFTHPKARRLLKREEFKKLFHSRTKFNGRLFSIEYTLRKDHPQPRLGITITKQYGKAHTRNLFKRRIKEIFRKTSQDLSGIDLNVRAKPQQESTYATLESEFAAFLNTLRPS